MTILLSVVRIAQATPGDLDMSFGNGGKVTTDFRGSHDAAQAIAIQNDGKIVVAGGTFGSATHYDFALARYKVDGSLDIAFGTDGKVITDFTGLQDVGRAVAIQRDGKIVVAGDAATTAFALTRYNANGALDSSFGVGGKVQTEVGFTAFGKANVAHGVAIQADRRIIAVGYTYNGPDHHEDFALVRYYADGRLDTSFGNGGKVTTDFTSGGAPFPTQDQSRAVALQPDGKIVVVGFSFTESGPKAVLARYNAKGDLDTTFGIGGKVISESGGIASTLGVQHDGKILVGGLGLLPSGGFGSSFLIRYHADGTIDQDFGMTGKVVIEGAINFPPFLALLPDGKIMLAETTAGRSLRLWRFESNGSVDTAFGVDGAVTTADVVPLALAVQGDGKPVVTGESHNGTDTDFAVLRFLGGPHPAACGPPDPRFVFVDNTAGFGVYEGLEKTRSALQDGRLVVEFDVRAARLDLPLQPDRPLRLWVSITDISFDAAAVTVEPNERKLISGALAAAHVIAPGVRTAFVAAFCHPSDVTFHLEPATPLAGILTLTDALLGALPNKIAKHAGSLLPSRILEFAETVEGVPDYLDAATHLAAAIEAALGGDPAVANLEVLAAGVALGRLALDLDQLGRLVLALGKLGVKVGVAKLIKSLLGAPLRLTEVIADTATINLLRGLGSAPIVITLRAPR